MTKQQYEILIKDSFSKTDFAKKLGYIYYNGTTSKIINNIIQEFNLNISHFDGGKSKNRKYERVIKKCPVCNKEFKALLGNKREKQTCSYSCANKKFRSGENNGMWKDESESRYTKICFTHHVKKCVVCDEDKIVAVHHYDHNHENNDPKNLVPLCPTHHNYVHSKYRDLVIDKIDQYVINFRGIA